MPDLDMLKRHLRILHDDEDAYLQGLLATATDQAAQYLDRPVPWCDAEAVVQPVPASVHHAILMLAADLYEMRESMLVGVTYSATPTIRNLLTPYRVGLGV